MAKSWTDRTRTLHMWPCPVTGRHTIPPLAVNRPAINFIGRFLFYCRAPGEAQILDLGAGMVEGKMVVDVAAIEIASNDEAYKITLQGSNSATFASGLVDLAELTLGAAEVIGGDVDSTVGRYTVPFSTRKKGTNYRYVRGYVDVSGAVATGISFAARLQTVTETMTRVTPTAVVLTTTTTA